jgi:Flp pilus assembly protein TadG
VRCAQGGRDDGTATIEFTFLSVLLLVPLVYVVLSASQVQRTAYAATEAARDAGRAYVRADSAGQGERRAYAAARLAFADQGLDLPMDAVRISCSADPCLTPGSRVTVAIRARAVLPGVPSLGRGVASVAVDARHVEVVDAFREVPP